MGNLKNSKFCSAKPMQIPFCSIFAPHGLREYITSTLTSHEAESLLTTCISAVTNKLLDVPQSPFLGLIHHSVNIQVFAFVSCTGWVIFLGLEQGPYDSNEVSRSFIERAYEAVVDASLSPFNRSLNSSRFFGEQIASTIQSHSVMMTFMASSHITG